ncbi:non-specific lipid-transfer protein 1-like [Aristolochia californica]|uniref:non-specific lipid-transfer protein 1-like n=1 Tax=Aristolochia californica TaxID=171875 RepID=UPI0035DA4B80
MTSVAVRTLLCFLCLSAMLAPYVEAKITCNTLITFISPCLTYLFSSRGVVPPNCCKGVKSLNDAARTTADRMAACNCLKKAAAGMSGINYPRAERLPSDCGVKIPYKISPSTNCATVK